MRDIRPLHLFFTETSNRTIHWKVQPKLRNINPHNVTHSLISRNPRERIGQISLLIVIFLSFISWILSLVQTTKEVNPYRCIVSCVNIWSAFFFFFFCFLCHLLNVGACSRHIAREGEADWTTLHHLICCTLVLFHSVTCYTNSLVSCIHVNATKHCNITCTWLP